MADLPIKNGDFPVKNGDFPMKNGDFPMKNGDFPWLCKRLPESRLAGLQLQLTAWLFVTLYSWINIHLSPNACPFLAVRIFSFSTTILHPDRKRHFELFVFLLKLQKHQQPIFRFTCGKASPSRLGTPFLKK